MTKSVTKPTDDAIMGVSFDLSKTRTGIAIWENQTLRAVFHETFAETHGTGHLLASFRHSLPRIMSNPDGITWIGYEDVRPVNKHHSEIHFGMLGVLMEYGYRREVHMLGVTATSAKKILTGSGKATKEEMLAAAREKYPAMNIQNHDEADAVAVGLGCLNMIEWDASAPEVEERVPF